MSRTAIWFQSLQGLILTTSLIADWVKASLFQSLQCLILTAWTLCHPVLSIHVSIPPRSDFNICGCGIEYNFCDVFQSIQGLILTASGYLVTTVSSKFQSLQGLILTITNHDSAAYIIGFQSLQGLILTRLQVRLWNFAGNVSIPPRSDFNTFPCTNATLSYNGFNPSKV